MFHVVNFIYLLTIQQVYATVGRTTQNLGQADPDKIGYVNQHGLSRKVHLSCFELGAFG